MQKYQNIYYHACRNGSGDFSLEFAKSPSEGFSGSISRGVLGFLGFHGFTSFGVFLFFLVFQVFWSVSFLGFLGVLTFLRFLPVHCS